MGYQIYKVGSRWGGYGVPAICEHPKCDEKIDRGMAFACGDEPFSELGCDRYFCEKHKNYTGFKCDGSEERCDHEDDCKCKFVMVCERCANNQEPFLYKPETKEWVKHLLTHESWEEWRNKNPREVEKLLLTL